VQCIRGVLVHDDALYKLTFYLLTLVGLVVEKPTIPVEFMAVKKYFYANQYNTAGTFNLFCDIRHFTKLKTSNLIFSELLEWLK